MSEEQFWKSNPRIINVWVKAWKLRENRRNELIHSFVGNYGLSALFTAIDGVLNGRKAKSKYIDKPIQLFELTEEEKEIEKQKAIAAFMGWANSAKNKFGKEVKEDGTNN